MNNELLAKLAEPFPPKDVTWKPGMAKGDKCRAMAYADLRAYQRRLDEVCGLDWSVEYLPWGEDRIIAKLTIAGSVRCSTGEMDAQDEKNNMGGTVAEAQAMKRACAMFGLGRYLYELPSAWVAYDAQARKISQHGQAELDKRYEAWYAKTMAQRAQGNIETTTRQVDTTTGEITEPEGKPDAGQGKKETKKPNLLSQVQLNRLHAVGVELYGKEGWEKQRPKLVEHVTKGAINSSKELTPAEADVLIAGIEKKIAVANAKVGN